MSALFNEQRMQVDETVQGYFVLNQIVICSIIVVEHSFDLLQRGRIQMDSETLELKLIQLSVIQQAIIVLVTDLKDPC